MRTDARTPPEDDADAACRVCGTPEGLTFEHFPPRSAGNRGKIEMLGIDAWLRREDDGTTERGRISQKGSGAYTLCGDCNNRAGRIYVPELVKWTGVGNAALAQLDPRRYDVRVDPAYADLEIHDVRPGRFMKQMATMLLAVSMGGVAQENSDLREYVRDPKAVGLSPRYQFYLALNAGPNARFNGGSVVAGGTEIVFAVELCFPPFSYVLSIDEERPALESGNITNFVDLGIDQTANVEMTLPMGFCHTPLPLDLRSKVALEQDRARNEADAATLWVPGSQ
jgi:hypothetical protein